MRANKGFAQYGVDLLKRYLSQNDVFRVIDSPYQNVRLNAIQDNSTDLIELTISLFNNPVMQLNLDARTKHPLDMLVFSGFHYDSEGNPSDKTRELLNGLLDYLGDEGIIPQNVRVIREKDNDRVTCYLSQRDSDNIHILNRDYCNVIRVKANPDRLQFLTTDLDMSEKEIRLTLLQEA